MFSDTKRGFKGQVVKQFIGVMVVISGILNIRGWNHWRCCCFTDHRKRHRNSWLDWHRGDNRVIPWHVRSHCFIASCNWSILGIRPQGC